MALNIVANISFCALQVGVLRCKPLAARLSKLAEERSALASMLGQ